MIQIIDLEHRYDRGTPNETMAIRSINLEIGDGELVGLIGHTGSGKSTLIQQLNGILTPSAGRIIVSGYDITEFQTERSKRPTKKELAIRRERLLEVRKRVGLVFQYPEYQLFEETVEKDIAFGPHNLGLADEEIAKRVRAAMETVGLDYEELKDRSPFELSGGQKRRVAIAGVLAMEPDVLILDEPTAGLDPKGRDELLAEIRRLHQNKNTTIIIVSHSMEDMARLAERLIVMNRGEIVLDGPPQEVFARSEFLEEIGLGTPEVTRVLCALRTLGLEIDTTLLTPEAAAEAIALAWNQRQRANSEDAC
ncbi:MAG: energy-coupling factor transporter ATPase [Bacillota bacterium]|nr:energy-coupling factor transporter ATPase [Bacillota bacterium]